MRQEECNAVRNPCFLGLSDFPQSLSAVNKSGALLDLDFLGSRWENCITGISFMLENDSC